MENVILIGMPGSGKSTAGVLLAKTLGFGFIDTDLLIQQREGMLLQDIINGRGIAAFLDAEEAAVLDVECTGCVISPGGSVVCRERAIAHLHALGPLVYLRLSAKELEERIMNITTRGIAMSPGQTLQDVYSLRAPLYERYADLVIDCTGRVLEETVDLILRGLQNIQK